MNIINILEEKINFINKLPITNVQKICLYQATYRLLSFDSQIYTVLHGSTVITKKGNVVLFGDGIDCIGKTTTSLIVALSSKSYICDEFSLYNEATGTVYGNKEMPILIRNSSIKYLNIKNKIKFDSDYETHILPRELGFNVTSGKLSLIISPHISDKNVLIKENNLSLKMKKIAITANAHRLKLTESGLDRVNSNQTGENVIEMIDWVSGYKVPDGLMSLPYYDAYLTSPSNIINLLEKEGL